MIMIEVFKILSKCAGINNKLDPKRLRTNDPQTGITDLSECQDMDIDDSGQPIIRLGQNNIFTTPTYSIFCDGGDCFVAQDRTNDTAIYRLQTNLTLSLPIVTGLVKSARVSWFRAGARTYYTNGTQHGRILNSIAEAWPALTTYGIHDTRIYSAAPVGSHIAYFMGRAWIAVDDTIYCSLPYRPGKFRFAKYFFRLGSTIRMMRPVAGGVWVSDSERTGFITAAAKWEDYRYTKKSEFPAHEWSDAQMLTDLSKTYLKLQGLGAVWSSDDGLCVGTPDGQLIITTEEKLSYPTGTRGATVIHGTNVINTIY